MNLEKKITKKNDINLPMLIRKTRDPDHEIKITS
jgi:hypothetical protein